MTDRFTPLKELHRETRGTMPEGINLRIHRALSWLQAAEQSTEEDTRFLQLWIAFNAAYAREFDLSETSPEKTQFHSFLHQVCQLDAEQRIHRLAWDHYASRIRVFVDCRYVFAPYWSWQQGKIDENEWERLFRDSKRRAQQALAEQKTAVFLNILFDRLYTLRNQLMHGGATWNSQMNREQLRSAVRILRDFVPELIHILMENPEENWGKPQYPPVG
ncbi:HEPN domain-containing protein [Kiritimatiellaeota bacterium B1221]|nr:HEPN domain-containing protein [Kiritimatiellaeota bacterium B1221]